MHQRVETPAAAVVAFPLTRQGGTGGLHGSHREHPPDLFWPPVGDMTRAHPAGLSLRDGLDLSGLTHSQLWLLYVGIGGSASANELAELIAHDDDVETTLDVHDHNVIAQALNEHFLDLDQDHPVGYREVPADT